MAIQLSGSLAITGSLTTSTTIGAQGAINVTNATNPVSFTSTASLYSDGGVRFTKDMYVSGTAYFNNVTVFGTQSIAYISSSQLNIGTNLITVNTDTPTVRFGGLAVYDSGSTGLTGSILWDSENNHWVYTNPSGSTYSGGMLISGPRNTNALGSEVGTTACALMMGQGGDHITSSAIFHYGNATCFYGNTVVGSGGTVCTTMTNASCVGIGTTAPAYKLDVVNAGTNTIRVQNTSNTSDAYLIAQNTLGSTFFGINATGGYIYNGGTLPILLYTSGSERMRIDSGGDVAIGSSSTRLSGGSTNSTFLTLTAKASGANALLELNGIRTGDGDYSGYVRFFNNSGATPIADIQAIRGSSDTIGTLAIATSGTERMRITSTGIACFACQICSTTISATTEFRLGASFTRIATLDAGGSFGGGYNLNWNNGSPIHDSTGTISGYGYSNDGSIRLYTNSSQASNTAACERMRIISTGEVGIGVTPTTGNRFWVKGSSTSSGDTAIFAQNSGGTSLFTVKNNGDVQMPNGLVSIYQTSAYGALNVTGIDCAWGEGIVMNPAPNGYNAINFRAEGRTGSCFTATWQLGKISSGETSSGEAFSLNRAGLTGGTAYRADASQQWKTNGDSIFGFNVGIGTTTPNYKLEVNGTSCFAGNVAIGGTYCAFALNVHGVTYQIGGSVWVQNGYGYVNAGAVSTGLFPLSDCSIQLRIANSAALTVDPTQNVGLGTTTPKTRVFSLGLDGGQVGAGGCGCSAYSGGGKAALTSYFGDQFGNGAPYGTSAGAIAPYPVWYGGGAGGYFKGGGPGGGPGGGGAGIVAIGGDGSSYISGGSPYADGGAGIYARGGFNVVDCVRTWAGYFDGSLYACGNVGIGTTSPNDKLHVLGVDNGITICSATVNRPVLNFINGSTSMLKLSANGTYGAIASCTGDLMFFYGSNVGIGTTGPYAKLSIVQDITTTAEFGSFGQFTIQGASNASKLLSFGFNTSTDAGFIQAMVNGTSYNNLLLNARGGNVLIGTTATCKGLLRVAGDAEVCKTLFFNGGDGTGGAIINAGAANACATPVYNLRTMFSFNNMSNYGAYLFIHTGYNTVTTKNSTVTGIVNNGSNQTITILACTLDSGATAPSVHSTSNWCIAFCWPNAANSNTKFIALAG